MDLSIGITMGMMRGEGGAPPLWDPATMPNLDELYDADLQTEADGAQVATLIGQVYGLNFTKNGVDGPVLRHDYINGLKAIECLGRRMNHDNTLLAGAAACSAFWVVKGAVDPASPAQGLDQAPLNGFGTGGNCHYYTDGNWYETFGSNTRRTVNPPTPWDEWHIAGVTSAAGAFTLWWNGVAILGPQANTVITGGATRTLFNLFAGHFSKLILLTAVPSAENRQKLEGLWAHLHGFANRLAADHPYKNAPPTPD